MGTLAAFFTDTVAAESCGAKKVQMRARVARFFKMAPARVK